MRLDRSRALMRNACAFKLGGAGRRGDRRMAVILLCRESRVVLGRFGVTRLVGRHGHVVFVDCGALSRRGACANAARTADVADMRSVNDRYVPRVDMRHMHAAEIVGGSVIGEAAIVPTAAVVTTTAIAEAIVDAP